MKRIVILISGRGSNMQAIVERCAAEGWPAKVVAVIASHPDAAGLRFAAGQGIATA
ncbi:MAG: formyltransferase family protein, partial [Burkholderiaceae bacterium]